jgi:hypothetical protein
VVVLRLALRWVSRGMYVLYDYPVRDVGALVVVCGHFLSRPGTYLPRQTCVVLACGGATAPAAGCWWLLQARRPCSALCAPVCPCVPCVAYRPVCEE